MITESRLENLYNELSEFSVPKFCQIRTEMTNNCAYHCFMCPRSQLTRTKGIMSIEDLNLMLERLDFIKYELDIHLHGYGEALLCNDLPKRCKIITSRKPNFTPYIFTTLGVKREEDYFEALFKNGLGKLLISCYGYDSETYKAVTGRDTFELVKRNIKTVINLQKKFGFQLRIQLDDFKEQYPSVYEQNKLKNLKLEFIDWLLESGMAKDRIFGQELHNFGCGFDEFPVFDKTVPCSILWGSRRSQLNISWDLNVFPCSYDFNTEYIWGNLKKQSLEEIFKGEARKNFLQKMLLGKGKMPLMCWGCYTCEAGHFEIEYEIMQKFMRENKTK